MPPLTEQIRIYIDDASSYTLVADGHESQGVLFGYKEGDDYFMYTHIDFQVGLKGDNVAELIAKPDNG